MSKILVTLAGGALLGLLACAAEPESGSNGTCSLSCSQPRVGSSTFKFKPLTPAEVNLSCVADFKGQTLAPANGPVQVRYQIYEEVPSSFPTDPASDGNQGPDAPGGGGGGGVTLTQDGGGAQGNGDRPYVSQEPRGGIGFEPFLYGLLSVKNSNEEFKSGPDSVSSFKYAGVVTSSSEWCSDSCGVVTYEFWPDCKQDATHEIQAGIAVSGGATSDAPPVKFTVAND